MRLLATSATCEGRRKGNSGAIRYLLYLPNSKDQVNRPRQAFEANLYPNLPRRQIAETWLRLIPKLWPLVTDPRTVTLFMRSRTIVIQTSVILMHVSGIHKIDLMIHEGLPC